MRRHLLLIPALAVAGCSLTLDTKELDPLQQPQGFCETAQTETIRWFERCFSYMSGYDDLLYGYLRSYCGAIASDVSAGAVTYSEGAAAGCIDAIRTTQCDDFALLFVGGFCPAMAPFGFPSPALCRGACRAAIAGALAGDQACANDFQCASGFCDIPPSTCGGTCVTGLVGDPCEWSHGCTSGNYCSGVNRCIAYVTSVGGNCDSVKCNPAMLYCDQTIAPHTCQPLVGAGGTCGGVSGALCTINLYCNAGTCATKAALGDPCAMKPCGNGLSCDASVSGSCIVTPTAPEPIGGDCHAPRFCDGDTAYCDDAATTPTYTCQPKRTSGPCTTNQKECAFTHKCSSTSECVPLRNVGESCTINEYDCRPGGTCIPNPAGGAWCVRQPTTVGAECGSFGGGESLDCFAGLTCDETAIPGHCVPAKTAGEICTGTYDSCADSDRGAYCDYSAGGTCTAPCW